MISIVLDIPVTVTATISVTNSSATSVAANSRCFDDYPLWGFPFKCARIFDIGALMNDFS